MRRLIPLLLRKWFRRRAEQGPADAQIILGLIYLNGEGVAQDYAEAVKWFRRAAERGDAGAQRTWASFTARATAPLLDSTSPASSFNQRSGSSRSCSCRRWSSRS